MPYGSPRTQGGHRRVVACGAISTDGKQVFRVRDRPDAGTLVAFLRDMHGKFGRVAVIVDRAPQHRVAAVGDCLCAHGAVRLIELPGGSPHLNAIGEAWRQARLALLVSGHHPTMGGDADGGVTALWAHEAAARRDVPPGPDVAERRHGLLIGSIDCAHDLPGHAISHWPPTSASASGGSTCAWPPQRPP